MAADEEPRARFCFVSDHEKGAQHGSGRVLRLVRPGAAADRKSTRLNSSNLGITYADFCLEKKHSRAAGLIIDILMASPRPITLVPIGPLTNIALALKSVLNIRPNTALIALTRRAVLPI